MVENGRLLSRHPDAVARRLQRGAQCFQPELLASHIRTCVAQDIRDGKDEVIDELVGTLQKLMK